MKYLLFFLIAVISAFFVVTVTMLKNNTLSFNNSPKCIIPAKPEGKCFGINPGIQYNQKIGKCEIVHLSGCSTESAFSSLEECSKSCK